MTTLCESAGQDKILGQGRHKSDIVKLHLHLTAIDDNCSGDGAMAADVDCAVVAELDSCIVYHDEIS